MCNSDGVERGGSHLSTLCNEDGELGLVVGSRRNILSGGRRTNLQHRTQLSCKHCTKLKGCTNAQNQQYNYLLHKHDADSVSMIEFGFLL